MEEYHLVRIKIWLENKIFKKKLAIFQHNIYIINIFWFWQDDILQNCFRFIYLIIVKYIRFQLITNTQKLIKNRKRSTHIFLPDCINLINKAIELLTIYLIWSIYVLSHVFSIFFSEHNIWNAHSIKEGEVFSKETLFLGIKDKSLNHFCLLYIKHGFMLIISEQSVKSLVSLYFYFDS